MKINKKQLIDEIKKITGKKKLILKDKENLIKNNYLDSFGYVQLASVIEDKYKIKINQLKFFDTRNANVKFILKILND